VRAWRRSSIVLLFAAAAVVLTSPSARAQPQAGASPGSWLLVSDIHFNPFDDASLVDALVAAPAARWPAIFAGGRTSPSPYFTDTNAALLHTALAAMKSSLPDPPVVIVAGDFLGHNFPALFARAEPGKGPADYDAFVDKTISFLAAQLGAAFPRAQFVIALGNNDGYCGDYQSTPNDAFLRHTADAFGALVDRNGAAPNFARDFATGGYYAVDLPGARGQALVLNSVFWSSGYRNACGSAASDPGTAELDWLARILRAPARGYRLVVAHIPPGIDAYSSRLRPEPVSFMQALYAERLVALLCANGADVSTLVFGHEHHATYAVVATDGAAGSTALPALIVPSISPVQGNNPSFLSARIDPSNGLILDTTTYAAAQGPSGAWQRDYDFDAAYGASEFDVANLRRLQSRLATDPNLRATFFAHYGAESTTASVVPADWRWYWCALGNLTATAYAGCISSS
jgi:hypothetical protein